jgi:hypothetical protein
VRFEPEIDLVGSERWTDQLVLRCDVREKVLMGPKKPWASLHQSVNQSRGGNRKSTYMAGTFRCGFHVTK